MIDDRMWRACFVAGGALFFAGGSMHPNSDASDFDESTAQMLVDDAWAPSHGLMLVGMTLIAAALVARWSAAREDGRRRFLGVVAAAGVLGAVEMAFHLAALADRDAYLAGESTPLLAIHLGIAVFAYPAFGLAMAALMVRTAAGRHRAFMAVSALGVLGAILHALAAPLVILLREPGLSFMFTGAIGIAVWLVVAGLAGAHEADAAPSIAPA